MLEKLYELVYVTGVTYFILIVSLIIMIGYLLGRITIKGVSLGTLINTCKSADVASAYASTYPIALMAVVIASQILILTL